MKTTIRIFLYLIFIASPFISVGQSRIAFKYDTLKLRSTEQIIHRTGDDLFGEVKYGRQDYYNIVKFENGYIKSWNIYRDGKICYEKKYSNGKLNGFYREWNKYGTLTCTGNYLNGTPNGIWTFYYNNGIKESEGMFCPDSSKQSRFSLFQKELDRHTGEATTLIGPWEAVPDGTWKFYNQNGNLDKIFEFINGQITRMDVGDRFFEWYEK